jgi:hypothetical protein
VFGKPDGAAADAAAGIEDAVAGADLANHGQHAVHVQNGVVVTTSKVIKEATVQAKMSIYAPEQAVIVVRVVEVVDDRLSMRRHWEASLH